MSLSPTQRLHILARLNSGELDAIASDWKLFAHPHQWPPQHAANGKPWTTWLMMGGRGAGKTRAGAEWIRAQALGLPPLAIEPVGRIALVGETEHDVREVMIEGVSGLLAVHRRDERPVWLPSRKRLEWNNGAVAYAFSAEDPESLRGPQFGCAWSDELAKWRYADAAFDMLQFGLRLGVQPRQLMTTTPRPTALIKRLLADESCVTTRAATGANALHLAPTFLKNVMARYIGTRLGRQELDGELIEDRTDALWTRSVIEESRVAEAPPLQRIVVAVDPPATSGKRADSCGIVAAGITSEGTLYVLADDTLAQAAPSAWALKAIALWRRLEADALVVEVNQGGEMVRAVIAQADLDVPVLSVRAHRAVRLIAENAASCHYLLYEGARELEGHSLLQLLARPNPRQDGASLFETLYAHMLLSGNAYVEGVALDEDVRELYVLRPDRMKVVPGTDGWAEAYEYSVGGRSVRFDQAASRVPLILHLTFFHPLDDHYGLAPLEAAAVAVDTHNAAAKWNKALLDNAARPSGALVYAGPEGTVLSDSQFERLKRELTDTYQGAANAGRPLLLEGGLDWKAMSLTPKDMDFLEAKNAAAREIALAFGVPPMLLGIPGDNTYANFQEANRALWRQTILPLASRVGHALTQWLSPQFGNELRLAIDTDRIEALASDRSALWERIERAQFLTLNEKRETAGYAPVEGGDRLS